jgi:hypothetical protein
MLDKTMEVSPKIVLNLRESSENHFHDLENVDEAEKA